MSILCIICYTYTFVAYIFCQEIFPQLTLYIGYIYENQVEIDEMV